MNIKQEQEIIQELTKKYSSLKEKGKRLNAEERAAILKEARELLKQTGYKPSF